MSTVSPPEVALIFACAANGVIGCDGRLPWHLPQDLAHFRALTTGGTVIMGRKTWQSLPPRFRPLPGRHNIVISRRALPHVQGGQGQYATAPLHADGAQWVDSVDAAIAGATAMGRPVWVIGGAQIYAQTLARATRVEATVIHHSFAGDAFAPELPGQQWRELQREDGHCPINGWDYSFIRYARIAPATPEASV